MTDVEFTRAFEQGDISNEEFHHLSHLHVAWVYLSESASVGEAIGKMGATLRRFAASAGKPEKYHETITVFWIRMLALLRCSAKDQDLDGLLKANPWLLEKNLPLQYYSPELLFSDRARTGWVEPDLKPLSSDATAIHTSGSACNSPHRVISG